MKQFWHFILCFAIVALGTAYIMQYAFAIMPCELCQYERLPYVAMLIISSIALIAPKLRSQMLIVLLINIAVALLLGIFHIGVEQDWQGFATSCVSRFDFSGSFVDFKNSVSQQPIVPCNQVQFHFLGLSLAVWNFGANCLLLLLTIMQIKKYDQTNK